MRCKISLKILFICFFFKFCIDDAVVNNVQYFNGKIFDLNFFSFINSTNDKLWRIDEFICKCWIAINLVTMFLLPHQIIFKMPLTKKKLLVACFNKMHKSHNQGILYSFFSLFLSTILHFVFYFTCRCIFWINIFRTIKFEEWKRVSLFSHILHVGINWIWRAKGKGDEIERKKKTILLQEIVMILRDIWREKKNANV